MLMHDTYLQLQPTKNRLLDALPSEELDHLSPSLQTIQLEYKQTVQLPEESVRAVYFPINAVLALVSTMKDGSSTEVGIVGNEGMAGLPALLGGGSAPFDLVVLIPGTAYCMSAIVLGEEVIRPGPLRDVLLHYTQAFLNQVAQLVACNRHHSIQQRLSGWLLMLHDRTGTDELPLTHEFLAQMLGVGRPSVTLITAILQQSGLIRQSRGRITIADRRGLEASTCECYRMIRDEYDRLLE